MTQLHLALAVQIGISYKQHIPGLISWPTGHSELRLTSDLQHQPQTAPDLGAWQSRVPMQIHCSSAMTTAPRKDHCCWCAWPQHMIVLPYGTLQHMSVCVSCQTGILLLEASQASDRPTSEGGVQRMLSSNHSLCSTEIVLQAQGSTYDGK